MVRSSIDCRNVEQISNGLICDVCFWVSQRVPRMSATGRKSDIATGPIKNGERLKQFRAVRALEVIYLRCLNSSFSFSNLSFSGN